MDIEINSSIKSAKNQLIVETATDLFMRYGVKRVTVEEICKTAKISKMTFYKYFKNKKELAEYIIFSILDNAQIEFDAIWNEVSTFNQKIDQFINLKMAYAKKFSKEFFIDFINLSPKIHDKVMDYSKKNQIIFINLIEQAQKNRIIRNDMDINFITFMLNHLMELAENEDIFTMYNNTEELTLNMINFYFYGIMGKK
jgi:AcrR family transcriptional regulator